ncbi:hypothetical protein PIB30_050145 [Stylosanthes scabra]|uniref:Zinc finger GRF-type domain-containing protein n=1 Tax=Stylosanthes scabra TaxID=79078 RepID=A0ABU6XIF2_9FABA|nr:hypothetical protein [Stylosanthes scabra]
MRSRMTQSMDDSCSYGFTNQVHKTKPFDGTCYCRLGVVDLRSKTKYNPKRWFYKCPKWREECQGFGSTLHIHVMDKDYIKMLIKYPWGRKICLTVQSKANLTYWGCLTGKLKTMLDQLADLGVKGNKLDRIIVRSPKVLLRKPEDFLQIALFFENIG